MVIVRVMPVFINTILQDGRKWAKILMAKIKNSPSGINSAHVRVYKYDDVSNIWTQTGDDIDGEFAADWLGSSVAMSADGRIIAAGASFNDANGSSSGHVRVVDC